MRDEMQEDRDQLDQGVTAARAFVAAHRRALVAVVVVLAVVEVAAVVALDGLWVKVATGVVLAQVVALFLFVTSAGDGGDF